jgi:ABC-type polysaccharide/polyol phosphate export permease
MGVFQRLVRDVTEMVVEQRDFRELLYQMTRRDLMLRYKQTVMGFGWAICTPLMTMVVFSVIFTRVAPLEVEGPYPLFAYCGLLAWNFSASAFRFAVSSLTSNATLVSKVYFPREIFPLSAVFVCLVDFAVGSLALVALMMYYGIAPSWTVLMLPVVLIVHVAFTIGVSLLLAVANLFYRDVKYLFELALMIWMFVSSVIYPTALVGGTLGQVLRLNPVSPILDGYRDVLLYGRLPAAGPFGWAAGSAVLILLGAWLVFHRAEFRFAENI